VVAKAACPHKPKKGEKRSGECRCDEQGRYCCLIEPQHWDQLLSLQKPTVDFYPTREALESRFTAHTPVSLPMTPAFSHSTPSTFPHAVTVPAQTNGVHQLQQAMSPNFNGLHSPASTMARFGMMGIGGPQRNSSVVTPNVLDWEGQAPQAPRDVHQTYYSQAENESCCQGPATPQPELQYSHHTSGGQNGHHSQPHYPPFSGAMPNVSMSAAAPPQTPAFDFNKLSNDYFQYQLPSAICQTCGLNGCTCRNCPPVMQNFQNGSWAQCCGRKHARTAAYVPASAPAQYHQPAPTPLPHRHPHDSHHDLSRPEHPFADEPLPFNREPGISSPHKRPYGADMPQDTPHSLLSPQTSLPDYSEFDPGADFAIPDGPGHMDLSEFLMTELEKPAPAESGGGCCCSGGRD
jgi:hypothetical protein